MFMADGATVAPNLVAWAQTVPVTTSTTYEFGFWLANIGSANAAQLNVRINGSPVGGIAGAGGSAVWQYFSYSWSSGASTSALIEIRDQRTSPTGNDFALDDISFRVAPEPGSLALFGLVAPLTWLTLRRRRATAL
jgi:hypothetical protein